ncbi:MFS transporter (plasmid) [Diaphorobacter sp. HDW4B]|uniref:MFS transporter n=1 Tax=Diaphorobacter sp. HDW4B TaxID=2714925 RepID=UPI00140CDCB7|nr:MFS transporter [Diaphorobacter sp. HDW4B]QIL74322.1 MFS transporter [Diaphorobacter sp. HDW4B]
MTKTNSMSGRLALMVGHCAGMVDLVALPIWVGTLVAHYGFDPQQAGMLASLFLIGAVVASVALASRFDRLNMRVVATLGFGLTTLGFGLASTVRDFGTLAVLHALCGLALGAALSATHGTIARSGNPHRLFGFVGMALAVFGILFMAATPPLLSSLGGSALFVVFAGVMAVATLSSALAFPVPDAAPAPVRSTGSHERIPAAVWAGIFGIACMGLVQAMAFSFLERVGSDHGFGSTAINGVLIALGIVNLAPPALAVLLQKRLAARTVMLAGAALQAGLVAVIMLSTQFAPYAAAASLLAAVMIFTHTFAFGLLAQLDHSGRAMAATPAMLMTGAAIGPVLGGTLVKSFGYGSLALAAMCIGTLALLCFARLPSSHAALRQEALT